MERQKYKMPLGMRKSYFYPIKTTPDDAHPTYDTPVDMGSAVKGYLSITTATAEIVGDDQLLHSSELFVSAQLDAETNLSDLEVNAKIFGHKYSASGGEDSGKDDVPASGGYGFIEPILKDNKTTVYRATALYHCTALPSSEKQEADTRKPSEFSPKTNAVSYKVVPDNTGEWRNRQDFDTMAAAEANLKKIFGVAG